MKTHFIREANTEHIAIVVLAAGRASRFGRCKLSEPLPNGKRLIEQTLHTILGEQNHHITLVCSENSHGQLINIAEDYGVDLQVFAGQSPGIGDSIAFAVRQCQNASGWLICLGDMPLIHAHSYRKVLQQAVQHPHQRIVVPVHHRLEMKHNGHPVYFGRDYFTELSQLSGDTGAKAIVRAHRENVVEVAVEDPHILVDIDTQEAFEQFFPNH